MTSSKFSAVSQSKTESLYPTYKLFLFVYVFALDIQLCLYKYNHIYNICNVYMYLYKYIYCIYNFSRCMCHCLIIYWLGWNLLKCKTFRLTYFSYQRPFVSNTYNIYKKFALIQSILYVRIKTRWGVLLQGNDRWQGGCDLPRTAIFNLFINNTEIFNQFIGTFNIVGASSCYPLHYSSYK